ncbi:MAG: spondin domain-containing protein [Myxococcota bacterium]
MRISMLLVAGLVACTSDTEDDGTTPMPDPDPVVEATTFEVTITSVGEAFDFVVSGAFATPDGGDGPAPIGPGGSYTFTVDAGPGQRLSLATMFVQSNDIFIAPGPDGIALWDENGAIEGDLTSQLSYWDAGTEADEEPGVGVNQAPRQPMANTGDADPDPNVRAIPDTGLLAVADLVSLTSTHLGDGTFEIVLANVSAMGALATSEGGVTVPLSPGVWAVHSASGALFETGVAAPPGLEEIAEDGSPTVMADALATRTGLTTPFAPGAYAVYTDENPLWTTGEVDAGLGLEALAEDGAAADLGAVPERGGAFDTPVGGDAPGPILPGGSYRFTFEAMPGDLLTFATMLVQSNDAFVGVEGLALFDGDTPLSGDFTAEVNLYDAGTEVNQRPGTGPDQAPRQAGPDTGADESLAIGPVADGFTYPAIPDLLELTVTALP